MHEASLIEPSRNPNNLHDFSNMYFSIIWLWYLIHVRFWSVCVVWTLNPYLRFKIHSCLALWVNEMLVRLVKNFVSKELLEGSRGCHKVLSRNISTSQHFLSSRQTAPQEEDIVVSSPLPSANYPKWTIDQYVWNDINQWSSKTALVRKRRCFKQRLCKTFNLFIKGWRNNRALDHIRSPSWSLSGFGCTSTDSISIRPWRHNGFMSSKLNWISHDLLGGQRSRGDCNHSQPDIHFR